MRIILLVIAILIPAQLFAQENGVLWGQNQQFRAVFVNTSAPLMVIPEPATLRIFRRHRDGTETLEIEKIFGGKFDTGNTTGWTEVKAGPDDTLTVSFHFVIYSIRSHVTSIKIRDYNGTPVVSEYKFETDPMSWADLDGKYVDVRNGCFVKLRNGRRRIIFTKRLSDYEQYQTAVISHSDRIDNMREIKYADWSEDMARELKLCPLEEGRTPKLLP